MKTDIGKERVEGGRNLPMRADVCKERGQKPIEPYQPNKKPNKKTKLEKSELKSDSFTFNLFSSSSSNDNKCSLQFF